MKKLIVLLTIIALTLTFAACSSNGSETAANDKETAVQAETSKENAVASENETEADKDNPAQDSSLNGKVLVAYFSATGTTKGVAEQIATVTEADTYEILAAQPYSKADLDWNDSNSRTTIEQNDKTVRPEIGSEKRSLDGYSTIYIGYPIWWGEEPRIMDTFVESYDFTGKTVIPFCTSGGSGIGSSGKNLEANAGSGRWLEGERLSASSDITGWINGLDL